MKIRTNYLNRLSGILLFSVFGLTEILAFGQNDHPLNVLLIVVDDLRTELGCYNNTVVRSPNIDRLAGQGAVFEKAYCMISVCGASRSSLLTGIRPKHDRFVGAHIRATDDAPEAVTLNTHLKRNGYTTLSNGKIFHFKDDNESGWSEPAWRPLIDAAKRVGLPKPTPDPTAPPKKGKVANPAWKSIDVPDDYFPDGMTTEKSLADLRRLAAAEKPFFLAVGFAKPHLGFIAPKKYWDLYDADSFSLPENYTSRPAGVPAEAFHRFAELRRYDGIPDQGPIPDETAKRLLHGYHACVSYIDAQIGRILDELHALGLDEKTVVVLLGDHGWMLGEHTLWCKHCVFEPAMNAPLIVRIPRQQAGRIALPVEFVDVYPTLCDVLNLPAPPADQLQGKSLLRLISGDDRPERLYAVGRYRAGDTIFDGRYRYSEFRENEGGGKLVGRMMYDHLNDPRENKNIVDEPQQAAIVERLSSELRRIMELP